MEVKASAANAPQPVGKLPIAVQLVFLQPAIDLSAHVLNVAQHRLVPVVHVALGAFFHQVQAVVVQLVLGELFEFQGGHEAQDEFPHLDRLVHLIVQQVFVKAQPINGHHHVRWLGPQLVAGVVGV